MKPKIFLMIIDILFFIVVKNKLNMVQKYKKIYIFLSHYIHISSNINVLAGFIACLCIQMRPVCVSPIVTRRCHLFIFFTIQIILSSIHLMSEPSVQL